MPVQYYNDDDGITADFVTRIIGDDGKNNIHHSNESSSATGVVVGIIIPLLGNNNTTGWFLLLLLLLHHSGCDDCWAVDHCVIVEVAVTVSTGGFRVLDL
jgi:hypothetical protein